MEHDLRGTSVLQTHGPSTATGSLLWSKARGKRETHFLQGDQLFVPLGASAEGIYCTEVWEMVLPSPAFKQKVPWEEP